MSAWSRLFIAVGILLLLGLGLCGIELFGPGNVHSQGFTVGFIGLGLCIFAVVTLVVGSIAIAVTRLLGLP